ncbi:carboxypeptidase-like regulatory domain-containing protein [Granulicella sp. L60]|uniref:carboxypeptidase-like regulatory domain-containing protein n=1 Tax=Granulicella sp. L60 TaxID=1641866 RepID=UPI00131BD4D2|nr:carboxypeptidase-like regulatory domain-containing protein [Granulicella sp. L60]
MNQPKRSYSFNRFVNDGSGRTRILSAEGSAVPPLYKIVFAAVLTLLSFCLPAVAQVTSGTILGSVQDTSGAIIPGAKVTATSPNLGITRTVTSSENGTFSLSNLPGANYHLTVTAKGFETLEKDGVILSSADKLNAGTFVLKVGAEATSVTVTADSGQLQIQATNILSKYSPILQPLRSWPGPHCTATEASRALRASFTIGFRTREYG